MIKKIINWFRNRNLGAIDEEKRRRAFLENLPPAERVPESNRQRIEDLEADVERALISAVGLDERITDANYGINKHAKIVDDTLNRINEVLNNVEIRLENLENLEGEEKVKIKVVKHWTDIFRRKR